MRPADGLGVATLVAALSLTHLGSADPVDAPAPGENQLARQPRVSSLEISGAFGPTYVFGEPANPEYTQSFSKVGAFGEFAVGYRSSYFVDPYLAVGYATLASGRSNLPAGAWGEGGVVEQHLGMWTISPGITADIWRFRPRFGLGISVVIQSFSFLGDENSSTQTPLLTELGLGFNSFDDGRFRLDLEGRAVLASGADITFVTFDAVLRGDVLYFVRN